MKKLILIVGEDAIEAMDDLVHERKLECVTRESPETLEADPLPFYKWDMYHKRVQSMLDEILAMDCDVVLVGHSLDLIYDLCDADLSGWDFHIVQSRPGRGRFLASGERAHILLRSGFDIR